MLQGWVVIAVALAYIGLLFLIASYGDRARRRGRSGRMRILIYPLSLAIYCTSWTFFGSVGSASRTGYEFLTIYIGPVLMVGLFTPLIVRIVRLAKAQNITSIADFIAARYGKAQPVAALVALIAIIGTIPYIALQLKAVSASLETILAHVDPGSNLTNPVLGDIALFVAISMATFAVLFGTRHIDATEHQDGLMLAVASESIIKLFAFLAVGIYVTFWMFGGPGALLEAARTQDWATKLFTREPPLDTFIATTILSFFAILLLPRQFHVAVVENNNENEIRRAAWLFPLYLVLINLFVVPIAFAGLLTFAPGEVDSDMFVLALPLLNGSNVMTIAAFVGGLSAATAMVIVELVALSIMVSNDIVMPLVLKRRESQSSRRDNFGSMLLRVRRVSIFVILLLAYMYYRSAGDAQLASIGLLSFAAVAQLAPAFFGGLVWRRATAAGAIAGMSVGILVWGYTLLLPTFADIGVVGQRILTEGPFGIGLFRPEHMLGFNLPPLVHGVVWSLGLNLLALHRRVAASGADADRASAGQHLRPGRPGADGAGVPPVAVHRDGRGTDRDRRPLSRRGAHALGLRQLRRRATHWAGAQRRSRYAARALCRASSSPPPSARPRRGWCCRCCCANLWCRPRRRSGCRRRQRRDPVQSRDPAHRAQPRPPGHRRARQGPAAPHPLEPAVRRDHRPAAVAGESGIGLADILQLTRSATPCRPSTSTTSCASRSRAMSGQTRCSSAASPPAAP